MEMTGPAWTRFPPELRLMILGWVIEAAEQDGTSLALHSTVCSEWQAAIEPTTFHSLKLTPARLGVPDFVAMVNRARILELVRHIGLFVPLPEYGCPECEEDVTLEAWQVMADTIWDGLAATCSLLSAWKRSGPLSLDITVQSPSDSHHHFRHVDVDSRRQQQDIATAIHDPRHGWENGRRVSFPPEGALFRLFTYMEFPAKSWQKLPQVTAVTSLCLRRQTTLRWSATEIKELVKHFVGLQELRHEPWRGWTRGDIAENDGGAPTLFRALPLAGSALSRLIVFEDFSEAYVKTFQWFLNGLPRWSSDPVRIPSRAVTAELAMAIAKLPCLEHLSASFLVDARYFFPVVVSSAGATGSWAKLVSLTLTSQLLAPDQSAARINDLLGTAAAAAERLPALESMELWNGREGLACVFQYQDLAPPSSSSFTGPRITWRATWDVGLEPRVVEAWREVVHSKRGPCAQLQVVKDVLEASAATAIKSHGDAICHLRLSNDVLHPVSLSQIRRKNMY